MANFTEIKPRVKLVLNHSCDSDTKLRTPTEVINTIYVWQNNLTHNPFLIPIAVNDTFYSIEFKLNKSRALKILRVNL